MTIGGIPQRFVRGPRYGGQGWGQGMGQGWRPVYKNFLYTWRLKQVVKILYKTSDEKIPNTRKFPERN
jgi:hypothetical protein